MMKKKNIAFTRELSKALKPFESNRRLKLIIHAGTPKTGTTSIQTYLNKRQRKLRGKGILYPHNLAKIKNPNTPTHQWFEKNLVTTHVDFFLENFKNIIAQVTDDTHTILLSSEGIYNYWWDFPEESKQLLAQLNTLFDINIWVWFREPLAFMESYYKQCIRNPQIRNNPCYGKDLSFAEMLELPWFAKHLNYQGFVSECQNIFGEGSVSTFSYEGDVVQEVIERLGLSTPHDNPTPRKNKSLSAHSIAILRTLNRTHLSAKTKERLMPHIREMNTILERCESEPIIDLASKEKVLALYKPVKTS